MDVLLQGAGLAVLIVGLLTLPLAGSVWAWHRGRRKLAIVLSIVGAVVALAQLTPSPPASDIAKRNACIANLKILDGAKFGWSLEMKQPTNAVPTVADLAHILIGGKLPTCPTGGIYTLGAINEPPRCSHADKGHTLNQMPKE